MGDLFVGSTTKGFTGMTAVPASKALTSSFNKDEVSPALASLLEALQQRGNVDQPTEVVIAIIGKEHQVFTFQLENLAEIQEILQWSLGR